MDVGVGEIPQTQIAPEKKTPTQQTAEATKAPQRKESVKKLLSIFSKDRTEVKNNPDKVFEDINNLNINDSDEENQSDINPKNSDTIHKQEAIPDPETQSENSDIQSKPEEQQSLPPQEQKNPTETIELTQEQIDAQEKVVLKYARQQLENLIAYTKILNLVSNPTVRAMAISGAIATISQIIDIPLAPQVAINFGVAFATGDKEDSITKRLAKAGASAAVGAAISIAIDQAGGGNTVQTGADIIDPAGFAKKAAQNTLNKIRPKIT